MTFLTLSSSQRTHKKIRFHFGDVMIPLTCYFAQLFILKTSRHSSSTVITSRHVSKIQRNFSLLLQQSYTFPPLLQEIPRYDFDYGIKDYYGNDFGHQETRDGYNTKGSYYVQLPDGRLQQVRYYVNGDSGFVAEVTYQGVAKYPATYGPAPSYGPAPLYR